MQRTFPGTSGIEQEIPRLIIARVHRQKTLAELNLYRVFAFTFQAKQAVHTSGRATTHPAEAVQKGPHEGNEREAAARAEVLDIQQLLAFLVGARVLFKTRGEGVPPPTQPGA